jgi:subtilisin family serine protease
LSLTGPSDRLLRRLLDAALARGIKLVGAVDPHSKDGGFPASHPGVLAVADDDSAAAAVGGMHMLIAPGRDIPTTVPGARWNFVSGPSFAAAHVSGLVALITELQPALAPALIRKAMGVDPAGIPAARTVDACATFARLAGVCSCSCTALHATPDAYP